MVVFEFKSFWLARPEGDDASDGIVGGNTHGHAISRDNFDAEAAHTPAKLGQHFVAGVALNPVKATAMDGHYRTLHVDEIVLAQTASNPFIFLNNNCAIFRPRAPNFGFDNSWGHEPEPGAEA